MDIHEHCKLSGYLIDIMKITGPMTPKQLNMFQVLIRDQEFKQNIADARRIAHECLSLDFNDNRSQAELQSNRKYESTKESDGDKLLRATAILQDILPKYFVSQLENKETQTYQTCTVDASVQTESDNTVSTNKLTTLMGDALVNVPDHAVGYIKDFLQSALNRIVNNSTKTNPIDQQENHGDPRIDSSDNNIQSISPPTTFEYFSSEEDLRDTKTHQTKYALSGGQMYRSEFHRSDFTPTESCMSHPSTLSYYTTISAIPYNWAAHAPESNDDLADDEYLRENLIVHKLDLRYINENPPVISDLDTDSSMWSISSCGSERAFKRWLKKHDMYNSTDTDSVPSAAHGAPIGENKTDEEDYKMLFADSCCKERNKKCDISNPGSERTAQVKVYITNEIDEKEQAYKRTILGRLNEKWKQDLQLAETTENIYIERSMEIFSDQSDVLDSHGSVSESSSCETYDDFEYWLNNDESYKPDELNKSDDCDKDNMELEIAKCQKAVNGELRNQTFLAIANEVSSSDTDEMTAREEADRDRRSLNTAYWVLAVGAYLKRKKALKESKGLFQIGPICDNDLRYDTENKETTTNEYINDVDSKRKDTCEEESESSVAETVDSEYPPYESDFSEEPYGGDSEIHIVTGFQLAVEQKDVCDEKQEPIHNQETYTESKSNGTKMTKDVMVESLIKYDSGATDDAHSIIYLIEAGEAKTRNTCSILGTRQRLQQKDFIDNSKAADQCFNKDDLPSHGVYLEKDQNTNDGESLTVSSASFDSFFGYDNPDGEDTDLPNEKDENVMENLQSFKVNEKSAELTTGTRPSLQQTHPIDNSKAVNLYCDTNTLPSDGVYLKKDQNANDEESFIVSSASFDSFFGYDNPDDVNDDDLANEKDENVMENMQSFKVNEKSAELTTGTKQSLQQTHPIDNSKAVNLYCDTNTLPSDGVNLKKDQNTNDEESLTVSSASFDSFFGYDNPDDVNDDDLPNEKDENLMENRQQNFKMNKKSVELITGTNNLDDMVFTESKNVEKAMTTKSDDETVSSALRERQFASDSLTKEKEGTKMHIESTLENSLSEKNDISRKCFHNEDIGLFHDNALSDIKADPSFGFRTPGSRVLYNGALVITDGGGDEISDDGSVIDMPEEELTKWKTSKNKINNKVSQIESNKHLGDIITSTPYAEKKAIGLEKTEIGIYPCEPFNQAYDHLKTPSQPLLAPLFSLPRRGMLDPLFPIQETIDKKDSSTKSGKKKSKRKKKIKAKVIKKESMQWPEPKPAESETHCDSSTGSFSMPSFELAEDIQLLSNENLSGSDMKFNADSNDQFSSCLKHVRFREDAEVFYIDPYQSSDDQSAENRVDSKNHISEQLLQSPDEKRKRNADDDFSDDMSSDSFAGRNFRNEMNLKMNDDFIIDSYESSDSG
ncbi:uncharacterized protein [Mytilus edulis]|uniref:uncharacterized protein n=1 Tax=Mytilus edulis TaxID=6550 RepID=UPI0039EE245B